MQSVIDMCRYIYGIFGKVQVGLYDNRQRILTGRIIYCPLALSYKINMMSFTDLQRQC